MPRHALSTADTNSCLLTVRSKWQRRHTGRLGPGKGMICHRIMEKTGKLAGIAYVHEDEDIMLITNNGIIIRTAVDQIPVYGRNTGGVIVMRLDDESTIMNFAAVKKTEEDGEQENQQ